jgi:hypothetical protein
MRERFEFQSGAEGDRTPDLMHAMDALSQLSYGPEVAKNGLPCGNPWRWLSTSALRICPELFSFSAT